MNMQTDFLIKCIARSFSGAPHAGGVRTERHS